MLESINLNVNFLILGVYACVIPAILFLLDKKALFSKVCKAWFVIECLLFGTILLYFTILTISIEFSVDSSFPVFTIKTYDFISIIYTSFFCCFIALIMFLISNEENIAKMSRNYKYFILLSFIILIGFLVSPIVSTNIYSGMVYSGQFEDASDFISNLFRDIFTDPLFLIIVALSAIGGLAKMIAPRNKAIGYVTNVLILWLPAMTWLLVLTGVIPINKKIIDLFGGQWFLAYTMYILLYGLLMLSVAGIQLTFQSLRPPES